MQQTQTEPFWKLVILITRNFIFGCAFAQHFSPNHRKHLKSNFVKKNERHEKRTPNGIFSIRIALFHWS